MICPQWSDMGLKGHIHLGIFVGLALELVLESVTVADSKGPYPLGD